MIEVAILGILAEDSSPADSDNTARPQVAEVIELIVGLKEPVAEYGRQ